MACEALKAQYDALEAQIAQLEAAIAKEPPQEQSVRLTRLHQLEDQAFALGQQLAACVAASTPPLPAAHSAHSAHSDIGTPRNSRSFPRQFSFRYDFAYLGKGPSRRRQIPLVAQLHSL